MPPIAYIKTDCEHCSGHIEYPSELAGQSIQCPHCQQTTTLPSPFTPPPYTGSSPVLSPPTKAKRGIGALFGLLCGVLFIFLTIFVIGFIVSNSGTSPSEAEPARQNYKSLTFQDSYFDVIRALGHPDKEIEERDVPVPNVVLGYAREKWIVYVMYSDRSFDKSKSHYLGIISTQGTVIHVSDEKFLTMLEALAYGIKHDVK